jgi:hypothetical protein
MKVVLVNSHYMLAQPLTMLEVEALILILIWHQVTLAAVDEVQAIRVAEVQELLSCLISVYDRGGVDK